MSKVDCNRITKTYTAYENEYTLEADEYALIEVVVMNGIIRIEIQPKDYIPDVDVLTKVYTDAVEVFKRIGGD